MNPRYTHQPSNLCCVIISVLSLINYIVSVMFSWLKNSSISYIFVIFTIAYALLIIFYISQISELYSFYGKKVGRFPLKSARNQLLSV